MEWDEEGGAKIEWLAGPGWEWVREAEDEH